MRDERKGLAEEHGAKLARRAGEHDQEAGAGGGSEIDGETGSRAVFVLENGCAFRDHGLDASAGGDGTLAAAKKAFDAGEDLWILTERALEESGDEVASAVVGSGAETTGRDDEISPGNGIADGGLNCGGGVVDGDLASDSVAALRKLATKPLLMGVEDVPKHQFAAGVDDFDVH